jgi:hypothetical protein
VSALSEKTRLGLEILGAAAVLGVAADVLLRATPWGLNAFLCTAGLVGAAAYLARRRRIPVSADAPWLAAAALLLGSNFIFRDSRMLRAFDVVGLAIIFCLACMSLRGVALRGRHAWEYVWAGVVAAATAGVGIFPLLGRDVRWEELPSDGALRHVRAVAAGTLLAFPLLLVFGALFASADAVFRNVVTGVFDIDFAALTSLTSHTLLIALGTALVGGYLWGALLRTAPRPTGEEDRGFALGIVPVGTALGLLDLLFLVFVVIQLRYFFGGPELVQRTTDLTYAEYARRGFFELVTASALVLPLVLGADWAIRHQPREGLRAFRYLAGLLLALLAVVMASALERMRLYVNEFGLSEIRLYSTAFMLYLAGVFVWFGWTALRGQARRFAFGALLQGFAVLAALHLLNPDAFIVRTNLARPDARRPFDPVYAASLGADAVPVLLAAFPGLDPKEQCWVANGLLARWSGRDRDWRNWSLARSRARRAVRQHEALLRSWAPRVTSKLATRPCP